MIAAYAGAPMDVPEHPFLQGERIVLRGFLRDDLEHYRRWVDTPDATYFMETGWRPATDAELEAVYASSQAQDTVVFTILDPGTGAPVGTVGLYAIQWICRRAEYRIFIGEPSAWNRGVGTEAARLVVRYGFEHLNLETILLGVNVENVGAVRSYEKAGFLRQGVRRHAVYRNGRYYDILMMGIVRDEYEAAKTDT